MKKGFKYWIDHAEEVLLVVVLIVMCCLTMAQVISRYAFNNSLTWTEELARYLFCWLSWLGISLAARMNKHITIDMVVNLFNGKKAFTVINILAEIITALICAVIFWEGVKLTQQMYLIRSVSPILRIPMGICYLSVVVGCCAMILRSIERIVGWIKRARQGYYEDPAAVGEEE